MTIEICGIYVTINNTMIIAIKNGKIWRMTSVIVVLAIPHPTNKQEPTGGVQIPIHKFMIIIIPKWMGCTPSCVTIGKKIGVKISTAGVMSIKVPTKSSNRLIISMVEVRGFEPLSQSFQETASTSLSANLSLTGWSA